MKVVIVGGVAGGASAAARARRLSEDAEIVLIERGPEPSFANCGLPYYVGGEIKSRDKLLVAPIELLRQRHGLDVRTYSEVTEIDRAKKKVTIRCKADGEAGQTRTYQESYDKLILSTGASPFRPPIPGHDSAHVLELRDLTDADKLYGRVTGSAKSAVIIGGGFIGIEVAENLRRRGLKVTLVELGDQILAPWDKEMVQPLLLHLRNQQIDLRLGDSVESFHDADDQLVSHLACGDRIISDFAVVCIGVQPESGLASDAGIDCGLRGGIVTNPHMQTSDPDIYAVGDVTEVSCSVSNRRTQVPLAGPANRQGRIAADHIFGRSSKYRGTQGTAIVGVFGMTAAITGLSEKLLKQMGLSYQKIYVHPSDHAGYYPGATAMTLKLLFDPSDGRILGAQGVGTNGVDKRIDVIAMAIQGGMTVEDLEESELCYAPQYGSAKDPVNMAGFVASGVLRNDHPIVHTDRVDSGESKFLLDVRTDGEFAAGNIPGAVSIPLEQLRQRTGELPAGQTIVCYCKVGQRGYMATRLLKQRGFDAVNLSGGYTTWLRCSHAENGAQ
tara:strand:- start:28977 stop:30644 length:1668 start_codon:yes stop_codon:yes gene_type:complete